MPFSPSKSGSSVAGRPGNPGAFNKINEGKSVEARGARHRGREPIMDAARDELY